jgi:aerotaxis receptor
MNQPVTGREFSYPGDARIVTTTDLDSRISYANNDFVDISGFTRDELIGQPHNLVRHPDMPAAAFADMWKTVKAGRAWMGMVKNRRKNGDHYWVDAFVTPVMSGNAAVGYQSVRVSPQREYVDNAEQLYARLTRGLSVKRLGRSLPLKLRLLLVGVAAYAGATGLALLVPGTAGLVLQALLFLLLIATGSTLLARPWERAAANARLLNDNPIACAVYTGRNDELGQLQLAIKTLQANLQTVTWRIRETTARLDDAACTAADTTRETKRQMERQQVEVDMVATALNEMTATVQEVARNASETADATRHADRHVNAGGVVVNQTIEGINSLAGEVEQAQRVISRLAEEAGEIRNVVSVIHGIADQTNLLALNAAIEAARAGEQGRGFAVVADEVRSLARNTQESTESIRRIIDSLHGVTGNAVTLMDSCRSAARLSMDQAEQTRSALQEITDSVRRITDMSVQIAAAAEQQSAVSDEINRNLTAICETTEITMQGADRAVLGNEAVADELKRLQTLVRQFDQAAN